MNEGNLSQRSSLGTSSMVRQKILESDLETIGNYIEDLKANIKLNKELVQCVIIQKANESFEDTLADTVMSSKAFEKIFNENKALEAKIEKAIEERNLIQSKNLLSEQIFNEWALRHNEVCEDYQEKISELKFQDERREKVVQELIQESSRLRHTSDLTAKSRNPSEVKPHKLIINLHCKIEEIKVMIENKTKVNRILETQAEGLMDFIEKTNEEIEKIQVLCRNPVNRKTNLERKSEDPKSIRGINLPIQDLTKVKRTRYYFTDRKNAETATHADLEGFKEAYLKKADELLRISEENSRTREENRKLGEKSSNLLEFIENFQKNHCDLTTEIKNDYENSLVYRLMPLDSISEIEVNHSNFYERSFND